ncbi:DUF1294 domain-containing protein [Agromyces sp. NPDC056379]|uniref:DUF1294 domain-containing protein n=1 Tax=unclassified Agromyces TaxID=2639701 RepID=UPI0035DCDB7A
MRLAPNPPRRHDRDFSRPLPSALSWTVLAVFAAALAVAVVAAGLPWWVPASYGVVSIVAVVAYGLDKRAAKRGAPRTSESVLLTVGVVGGWPGALVAQQLFRHKTRKRSFRRAFWLTVVVNSLVLAAFIGLLQAGLRMPDLDYSGMLQ